MLSRQDTPGREPQRSKAIVGSQTAEQVLVYLRISEDRTGEEAGGYKKADGASDLNFVIVHKPAVIQYHKHAAPKIVTPDANQDGDAYKYGYRLVSIADLYANKLAGVYASYKPVAGG